MSSLVLLFSVAAAAATASAAGVRIKFVVKTLHSHRCNGCSACLTVPESKFCSAAQSSKLRDKVSELVDQSVLQELYSPLMSEAFCLTR